nr:MAG TPA: hypothetical protein [Caudoviricetes sp.]
MNLTTEELIKLVQECDSKAVEFENNIVKYTAFCDSDVLEYISNSLIVILGLIKLKKTTVDEVLEKYVNNRNK